MTDYTPPIDPQSGEFCYVLQVADQYDGFKLGQAVAITVDGQVKAGRLRAFRCAPGGRAAGALVELSDPGTPWVYVRKLGEVKP
jgi:hypothetical protein